MKKNNNQGDRSNSRSGERKTVANITNKKDDEVIVAMVFECYLVKDGKSKGKVSMKITAEKIPVLSDVLYVSTINHCLV
ncbi:hypothetical protein HN51_007599, partial [Arachis hypogaea]